MKKIFKAVVTAVSLVACLGAFAFGSSTKASADLHWTTMEKLEGRTPECALFLEEPKVKNMTDYGYYNVDGQDVWYFYGDNKGGERQNPEIRFVTEGTDTTKKIDGKYTFAPMQVDSFSFDYRIDNKTGYTRVDDSSSPYIVQILASDGTYPIIIPDINEDGGWHTIYVDQWTPVSNAAGNTYESINHLFSGIIFKMAGLDGELMISNIDVVVNGYSLPPLNPYEEPELPETSEEPEVPEVSEEPELPETSQEPEVPEVSEEPTTSEPSTNEPTTSEKEGVLAMLGCNATASGASVLLGLAGAGFVMAIRKRKE